MNVAILVNPNKVGAPLALNKVIEDCLRHGLVPHLDQDAAKLQSVHPGKSDAELANIADFLIVLGGDGTMLHATKRFHQYAKPMAGVNIGTLGFLTTCTVEDFSQLAEAFKFNTFHTIERMMLEAEIFQGDQDLEPFRIFALNEITLTRGATARMVDLEAHVDGELLNHYRADGLIVTTPTGSTAYSLSAGGPLIAPNAAVFGLTPICPHTLTNRSLIVSDRSIIELKASLRSEDQLLLSADGTDPMTIEKGQRIRVQRAAQSLPLVHLHGHSYYEKLRQKLRWSGGDVH